MPIWLVKILGLVDTTTKQISQFVGNERYISADKARKILGWRGREVKESILQTANQLKELGLEK
ncbi:hypothetical protein OAM77_01770 [Alphaproteobacteria bacterium]|jgi:hypothetical protein|nr:hypothetical protein [Alphaproteobacteria bacterium]MDC3311575.1 hypothetical protein [Alphaproteobacteria bacterium]